MADASAVMDELLSAMIVYAGEEYEQASDQGAMESFMTQCLEDAVEEIMHIMYPNGIADGDKVDKVTEYILNRYKHKVRYIAEYHFDKQGKEGTILYSENDTSAHFESSGTPASYLKGIVPIARVY